LSNSREPRAIEFEVPIYERPTEEIEIPEESERLRIEEEAALVSKHAITRLTQMFRKELEQKLDQLEAAGQTSEIEFDEFLQDVLKTTIVNRRVS